MKPLALAVLAAVAMFTLAFALTRRQREYSSVRRDPSIWEPGPRGTGHSRRYVEPDDGVLPTDPRCWTLAQAEGRIQWCGPDGRPVF